MKTRYLKIATIIGFSLFSGFASAQKTSKYKKKTGPELKFGITAGAVYSFQSGYEYSENVKGVVGVSAGAFANYAFSDKLKLQLAALYNQYGTDFTSGSLTYKEKQTYISFPLTLKTYFTDSFYFNLGPQVNVLVSSTFDNDDINDMMQKTDFGLTGGLGFNFTENIGIDLNYYYGLSKIYTKESEIEGNIIYNAATARLFYEF